MLCINPLLSILALVSLSQAFTVPTGTAEGVYAVYIDESGNEIHERRQSPPSNWMASHTVPVKTRNDDSDVIFKRADNTWCGCGLTMNHGDCDAVVADLQSQFEANDYTLPDNANFYSIRGSVIAFACNPLCCKDTIGATFNSYAAYITEACGWYVPGTVWSPGFPQAFGYMNYYDGLDFCGASTSSPLHTC
jgi:hypothetical protein